MPFSRKLDGINHYLKQMHYRFDMFSLQQKNMPKYTLKWTSQEENMLRTLRGEQNTSTQVNWQMISQLLNEIFHTNKTSKQCRQRYINYLKFGENITPTFVWTQEQLDLLIQLYLLHGSSWSIICTSFQNKSENSIKNKFNNSLKKAAKCLQQCELKVTKKIKKNITPELLNSMLDFVNQIQKFMMASSLAINPQSYLYKFKYNLLQVCFAKQEKSLEQSYELVKLIKFLNANMRSFGHFKVKNMKNWKLSSKNFQSICRLDKIVLDQIQQGQQRHSIAKIINEQNNKCSGTAQNITGGFNSDISQLQLFQIDIDVKNSFQNTKSLMEQYNEIINSDEVSQISIGLIDF